MDVLGRRDELSSFHEHARDWMELIHPAFDDRPEVFGNFNSGKRPHHRPRLGEVGQLDLAEDRPFRLENLVGGVNQRLNFRVERRQGGGRQHAKAQSLNSSLDVADVVGIFATRVANHHP